MNTPSRCRNVTSVLVFLFVIVVFHNWFTPALISSGDLHYRSESSLKQLVSWPQIWQQENKLSSFYSYPIEVATGMLARVGFSYVFIERIIWLYPYLFFSYVGMWFLSKRLMPSPWPHISGLLYTVNTYSLMIISGGQAGVGLGYAFAPWVFIAFLSLFEKPSMHRAVWAGLALTVQTTADLRLAYITTGGIGIVMLLLIYIKRVRLNRKLLSALFVSVLVGILLESYWIVPYIFHPEGAVSGLNTGYTDADSLSYFSFADFSHALSWLQPNWPENIFGKTYFLYPQFILIPVLALGSLFYIIKRAQKHARISSAPLVLSFTILVLIGTFLAKGVNPPFGEVYRFLYKTIPGFIMFRDPTKFYLLISIAYSILLPYGFNEISNWLLNKSKLLLYMWIPPFVALALYAGLLYPALNGQVGGTLRTTTYPLEYEHLKNFLVADGERYRILWVPQRLRFGYYSGTKYGVDLLRKSGKADLSEGLSWLSGDSARQELARYRVRYVIVPYDSQHELFVKDRTYDAGLEEYYHSFVRGLPWLTTVEGYKDITIGEISSICPALWIETDGRSCVKGVSYENNSPTGFTIRTVTGGGRIVLSETYEDGWVAVGPEGREIHSQKTWDKLNSFAIPPSWSTYDIVYKPQRFVDIGAWISLCALVGILGYLLFQNFGSKRIIE